MHLSAAHLVFREDDFVAEALDAAVTVAWAAWGNMTSARQVEKRAIRTGDPSSWVLSLISMAGSEVPGDQL